MPFKLTSFERQIFMHRNWGPGPLLDMFGALAFRAVAAAVKLDIFNTLETLGPASAAETAEKIGAGERGVALLLQTLASLGYVRRVGESRYANAPMASAWMTANSPFNLSGMTGYFEDASERWSYLDKSIRGDAPFERCNEWLDRHNGGWERYHAGMSSIAQLLADEVVKRARLSPGAKRMIDIGGSHGLYSIRFCQRYPALSAVIYDCKEARSTAEKTIQRHAMHNRVSFKEGDFIIDELGAEYDAALLFNAIRIFPENEALKLLQKIRTSLVSGGTLFIADQFCTKTPSEFNKANALLILLELYNGCPTHPYSAARVKTMLLDSGFDKPKEIFLRHSPGISIVAATRGG